MVRPRIAALKHLDEARLQEFSAKLDAIGKRVMDSRGPADERYIRRVIFAQRCLEALGRVVIFLGILYMPLFFVGAVILGIAKIIENMEIGHNVLHGQWDWLKDPKIHSSKWEWDGVCPSKQWQRSHNYIHHKWTNVIGMDRDYGYHVLRMSDRQPWKPVYLFQPVSNMLMAIFFEWGVAIHDDEMGGVRSGEKSLKEVMPKVKKLLKKIARQVGKDYILFPLLAGPYFLSVLLANIAANLIRNLWAYAVIFCGHFPDGVEEFTPEDVESEDKARWYVRQILGSANIEGGKWMHFMSGNLSHQIEHHIFPRMPSNRYAAVAREVKPICEEYGIRYNSNGLAWQLFTVWRKVFRYALPPRAAKQWAAD
ncbi:MAG: acyl-CoA desaturase [Gammaproteobacteria bacterium HGW-Gammaproteobacteria-14]|nr:MAG: acyl-CoA desaturase [Gammaproteobacteria bacterium HGW-Gammaproteobacteria-14]